MRRSVLDDIRLITVEVSDDTKVRGRRLQHAVAYKLTGETAFENCRIGHASVEYNEKDIVDLCPSSNSERQPQKRQRAASPEHGFDVQAPSPSDRNRSGQQKVWTAFSVAAVQHVTEQAENSGILLEPGFFKSMQYVGDTLGGQPCVPLFRTPVEAGTQLKFHMLAAGPDCSAEQWNKWDANQIGPMLPEFICIGIDMSQAYWLNLHSQMFFGKTTGLAPIFHYQFAAQLATKSPGYIWQASIGYLATSCTGEVSGKDLSPRTH
jgi:hypothetical protein